MSPIAAVSVTGLRVGYDGAAVVHGIDLHVESSTVTALVGESGCGKSSTALAIARLLPNNATVSGAVVVDGIDLLGLPAAELAFHRGSLVGYVPQSTSSSLNPVRSVGTHLTELFRLRGGYSRKEAQAKAAAALLDVEIGDPERVMRLYQHQLSGGMRQRVAIAMALALKPRVLIADEPTTALDTTVQAEILALVQRLQREHQMSIIWITHDLGVVGAIADHVAVLYTGRIVEQATTRQLFEAPAHPYTQGLLASYVSGQEGSAQSRFIAIAGQPPTGRPVEGCTFHPRCPVAVARCRSDVPAIVQHAPGHFVTCHLVDAR